MSCSRSPAQWMVKSPMVWPFFSWSNRIICVWLATWVWQSHKQTMSKAFLRSGYIRNTSSFCDWLYRLDQKARKSDLRYNPPFQQPTGHQATPLFRSLRRLAQMIYGAEKWSPGLPCGCRLSALGTIISFWGALKSVKNLKDVYLTKH